MNDPRTKRKAVLIGATGAVGRDLLHLLLADEQYQTVTILVRREPDLSHPKLTTHLIRFDYPEEWAPYLAGADVAFSCLGTTLHDAGSPSAQHQVDYGYQWEFARAARQAGVPQFVLVSSIGADSRSRSFYLRMKGQLEESVQALDFPRLVIARPPMLIRPGTTRWTERIALPVLRLLNGMGMFRQMTPMPTAQVAADLLALAADETPGYVSRTLKAHET